MIEISKANILDSKYYSSDSQEVIVWKDNNIPNASGWIVIDKIINGVSGGGLFMHKDATLKEVKDLSKSMTYKNSLQQPLFGGAKAGIKFDHRHPEAKTVLKNFLIANKSYLVDKWCTGADLNTSNKDIFSIVKNHLYLDSPFISLEKMLQRLGTKNNKLFSLDEGLNVPMSEYFSIGNGITGYLLLKTVDMLFQKNKECISPRIALQGFGKVGKSFAYYVDKSSNGKIVAIIENDWALINEKGINIKEILSIKNTNNLEVQSIKNVKLFTRKNLTNEDFQVKILKMLDINAFCPCACRYVITRSTLSALQRYSFRKSGLQNSYIVGGANNIFYNNEILLQAILSGINFLPEWVSNSGNALLFLEILKESNSGSEKENLVLKMTERLTNRLKNYLQEVDEQTSCDLSLYERCHEYSCVKINKNLM